MKLEEIKRLNTERTQGEWSHSRGYDGEDTIQEITASHNEDIIITMLSNNQYKLTLNDRANAAFIAAAPTMADMLVKLAEFEVIKEFVEKVRDRLVKIGEETDSSYYDYWDYYVEGKIICQAVIDQLKEEICK